MNKCKASAFKNLDLKKSNFLEKKMYPILDTRVGCKVEKKIILKYYDKKIFLIKDCKTKSI